MTFPENNTRPDQFIIFKNSTLQSSIKICQTVFALVVTHIYYFYSVTSSKGAKIIYM